MDYFSDKYYRQHGRVITMLICFIFLNDFNEEPFLYCMLCIVIYHLE
ncbi:unnamed protein product [Schistosoma curassoni]|uniref:DUF2196 domain-containing protein n=1 Tax=Schistosoma curassoni TaxID=6186 RepID=A0A183L2D9_9TREM|nr:unnamed protein product [Schistosoma curassoni]